MSVAQPVSIRGFSRDVWLISTSTGALAGAFLGIWQLLRVLYALRLGYGPEFLGVVFAAGALSFTLFSLPGGTLGGRFGVRRVMIVGTLTNVLGMSLLPLTESIPEAAQRAWLLLVEVVSSGGWSVVVVNQVAAMMGFTVAETRKNAYAFKEAVAGFGVFLGALVGGILPGAFAQAFGLTMDEPAPYRYGLYVAIAAGLTSLIPLVLVAPVRGVTRSPGWRVSSLPLRALSLLVLCAFLNHSAVASCKAFSSAYMDSELGLPSSLIGAISSVGMFLAIPGALASPRLARRRGSGQAMIIASLGLAGSLLFMGVFPHWVAAGLGTIGMLALAAMWVPGYQVTQMEMAGPEARSLVAGAASMAMSLGYGTMSFTGGYIAAVVGYRRVFLLGVGLALSSALVMWTFTRHQAASRADPARGLDGQLAPFGEPSVPEIQSTSGEVSVRLAENNGSPGAG